MKTWKELRTARKMLSGISAQDEFAKWARQQRVVDKLQAEFDKLSIQVTLKTFTLIDGERQRAIMAKQMGMSITLRVLLYSGCSWWVFYQNSKTSMMSIPTDLFGPFSRVLSFPQLETGIPDKSQLHTNHQTGQLSASALFGITTMALNRLIKLYI
jgi:hypothetical protein